jgi:hypothetical protein
MLPKRNELPREYHIFYSTIGFDELPMPEEEARTYIHSHPAAQRAANLRIDIHIQDKAPRPWTANARLNRADFSGQAARIGVVSANDQKVIGSLLDDGTIGAPPAPEKTSKPGMPTKSMPPAQLGLVVSTVAYVAVVADTCGWPITPEQRAKIKRFISVTDHSNLFQLKLQLNSELGQERERINSAGRLNFCESQAERQRFDRRAATLRPKGSVAAPPDE